jgi:hypothetical protein
MIVCPNPGTEIINDSSNLDSNLDIVMLPAIIEYREWRNRVLACGSAVSEDAGRRDSCFLNGSLNYRSW